MGSPLGGGGSGQGPTEGLLWWHLSLCTKPHLLDLDPRAEELLGPQSRGTLFHVGRGWFGLSTFLTAPAAPPAVWIPSAEECLLPALPSPQPGYHRAAQGWEGTAAPHIVTSLVHHFPAKMKTWNWGNPSFSVLQVFPSKLVTKPSSNVDNVCVVKLGSPPLRDGDSGSNPTPAESGGTLLAAAPFVLQPDPAEMAQTTGTAGTELEHRDCTRISWDQRSWGKETCNKHRAFIQALG